MKIGYVAHPYEVSHASGMGYSMLEGLKQIVAKNTAHEFVVYSSTPIDRALLPGAYINTIIPRGLVRQFFWFLFLRDNIEALFFIAPLLPLWLPTRIRPIVICKELGSQKIRPGRALERIVAFVRDRVLMPVCLIRAEIIVASSEATRDDILTFYPMPREKVVVIPEGYQEWSAFSGEPEGVGEHMNPFFFFAGKVKPRKNVHGIVAAFIDFKKRTGSNTKLVIAGDYGGEYYAQMKKSLETEGFDDDAFFLGYVSAPSMRWLYSNAQAFLFPSINEGFGMPLVEAMSFGVPTLTSENSPMAEIAEGASLLVDPLDVPSMSRAMERLLEDQELRGLLIEKGKKQAALFSWDKTGERFRALIETL